MQDRNVPMAHKTCVNSAHGCKKYFDGGNFVINKKSMQTNFNNKQTKREVNAFPVYVTE